MDVAIIEGLGHLSTMLKDAGIEEKKVIEIQEYYKKIRNTPLRKIIRKHNTPEDELTLCEQVGLKCRDLKEVTREKIEVVLLNKKFDLEFIEPSDMVYTWVDPNEKHEPLERPEIKGAPTPEQTGKVIEEFKVLNAKVVKDLKADAEELEIESPAKAKTALINQILKAQFGSEVDVDTILKTANLV